MHSLYVEYMQCQQSIKTCIQSVCVESVKSGEPSIQSTQFMQGLLMITVNSVESRLYFIVAANVAGSSNMIPTDNQTDVKLIF